MRPKSFEQFVSRQAPPELRSAKDDKNQDLALAQCPAHGRHCPRRLGFVKDAPSAKSLPPDRNSRAMVFLEPPRGREERRAPARPFRALSCMEQIAMSPPSS